MENIFNGCTVKCINPHYTKEQLDLAAHHLPSDEDEEYVIDDFCIFNGKRMVWIQGFDQLIHGRRICFSAERFELSDVKQLEELARHEASCYTTD